MRKRIQMVVVGMVCICALLMAGAASAADVEIHGYGNQDFIKSNKNQFLEAKDGTWNHNTMSLVFSGRVTDDTVIWSKIFAESEKTTIEWLYVDYKLANNVDFRAGQMKLPLGIFNLIRDMKFLHLAELEPSMYSNNIDVVFENYRGVGLEYNHPWFTVELIGGAPEHEEAEGTSGPLEVTGPNTAESMEHKVETKNLVGGRIKVKTPVEGLSFMFSGATYHEKRTKTTIIHDLAGGTTDETAVVQEGTEKLLIGSIDLAIGQFDLKAEYAQKKGMDEEIDTYYVEAGYTFRDRITPYVRYDHIVTDKDRDDDPSYYQKDTTVGIGFKINDYFKVKAEQHFIKGYALPVATGAVRAGAGEESWSMFVAGVNFLF